MTQKLKPYWNAVPDFLKFQIVSKALIAVWMYLLGIVFRYLLESMGRVAVTTGDFLFLLTSWQGILIILIALISLYLYVAVDLNAKIALCADLLTGGMGSLRESISKGVRGTKNLTNLRGILVVLYIALIAPLLGFGALISLTEGLYIPTFISDVIKSTPLYLALYIFLMLVFLSFGIANLYILHGAVLDDLPVKEAGNQSRQLIHENWKDYLKQNVLFLLTLIAVLILVALIVLVLPLALVSVLPLSEGTRQLLTVFFVIAGVVLSVLADLFGMPFYLMKMTQLFYSYKNGESFSYREGPEKKHPLVIPGAILTVVLVIAAVGIINSHFDTLFPKESDVKIIGHRGGGYEAAENTLAGLETAYRAGAYGSEIDIQRTKDGYYILNHDNNLKRVTGNKGKPEEMTLEEIRTLSIDGEPVAEFEEVLQACRGKLVLYIELKGKTADRTMADDAVRLIRQYGMEEECVLISLKYDLIDYLEKTYPDIKTGFLTFASFGDTALLNCDYLGLEEESATMSTISSIHKQDKKALVWTVDQKEKQRRFLCSDADGIITNNITQAVELQESLADRSVLTRMLDRIMGILT